MSKAKPAPEQYTALEQALTRLQKRYAELEAKVAAQPAVQEPFGYVYEVYCLPECALEMEWVEGFDRYEPDAKNNIRNVIPVYTTPPAPQPVPVKTYHDGKPWPVAPKPWVNLTVDELIDLEHEHLQHENLVRAIEAKLKEKNT